ncbi:MAG: hypothetical protein ACI90Q_001349 [Nonlabens sp.]
MYTLASFRRSGIIYFTSSGKATGICLCFPLNSDHNLRYIRSACMVPITFKCPVKLASKKSPFAIANGLFKHWVNLLFYLFVIENSDLRDNSYSASVHFLELQSTIGFASPRPVAFNLELSIP